MAGNEVYAALVEVAKPGHSITVEVPMPDLAEWERAVERGEPIPFKPVLAIVQEPDDPGGRTSLSPDEARAVAQALNAAADHADQARAGGPPGT